MKFFHGVNTETRALIERSSRKGELTEAFKMSEISSISTLEVAWENRSLWRRRLFLSNDETWFCERVAETNKLELLKWAREEKKCEWDYRTITMAAKHGNLEMVKYCVANKCPIDGFEVPNYLREELKDGLVCAQAAGNGHLEVLKYLREEGKAPWDWQTATWAARNGHLHILEYLVERKFDEYNESACEYAAKYGQLDCLKYLRETAKAPWDSDAVRKAHKKTNPNVYNTSSTTTVLSQKVGRTRTESSTCHTIQNQN